MKLKQFIFALVAMLSFSFSAFAQSTVSTEADLKAALESGGEVTLGASITVSAPVTIPSSSEVVLNLNGKTLKATNAKTEVLKNQGKLTINGQGTVSGIIYNGTANGSTAEMTLNGGTYSLDGNNGGLHHYGKTLTINDGVVVKTTSYGVRMAGKGSVLNLNGGTYTSTGTGDMARPLALSNGTVNFLDSDITVNGHMHVMVGQVTVNFGENNQYSPFEAYHQGNSYASSVFYCKTLAEAISRTGFAAVTLVKNVKVAADAPITVNKEINLNLNGKNLSATNAKTTVLKNYANLTIKGKGTVTGLVYNGDAENKGVAEMTLDGGTYKLDGANGGFFNYGKTLTVNDGVTISSQVYGLRMSNAASVINLNGGTFTSTNPTDNMKRAIAVDAGTINFNDDDITINGYFHANRSKAKVNFGEYCPFDAFMYSTTNASGYYVVNLENAIDKADAGFEIVLQKNLERSEIVTLPKKVTLDGNGKTLTSTAGRAINVDCADVVTIENLTIAGAAGCERGINIINKAGTTNLKKVNVSGVSYYAVHVATSAGEAQVNIENSNLTGWAAVAAYGENGTINVKNSNLVGINNYTGNSNDFATVAAGSNVTVNVTGGKVTAESFEGKADQAIVCAQSSVENAEFKLDAELELKGTAEFVNIDLDKNKVTVREVYGTNYVTTPAGNGLVTLTGASEAMIGDVKYPTIAQAFAAAKEDETITLIADVTPSLTSQRAITKAAVIDLGGKTMTLNNADLYFGTTTFKNGTIVVAPSVYANTAVFWMFENQALAFDNVDIVATGVTGTYLIGINGGTGTTVDIINGSSITIDNESEAKLTAVICDNGTGNTVTIKDSDIDVKNIEGRFYLGGKNGAVVVENTEVDLNGVKEGFYLRAGQSLDIAGTSNVNVVLNSTEGRYGINVTDATAKYNKADSATVNATVYEVPTQGSVTPAFTGATSIWGEGGGNARESLVVKLYSNETLLATASLNNVNGIINGNVYVSWSIPLNAAGNDEYWDVQWAKYITAETMPTKVVMVIDGVEVAENNFQLNSPDDLNKMNAAIADADGKFTQFCSTFEAAVEAGNNVAILKAGTYALKVKDGITITGAVDGVEFANIGAFGCNGANVTFNNVTFTYASNSQYNGLQHSGNLVYNNCTFNGQVFLYGNSETFNNCTFNTTDAANYNVWTYGAKEVAFNECTFNSAGKSVLIYAESASVTNNVTVKDCTFKASQSVEGKAAIELDSSLTSGANLTITNSTATGFGTGNVSGNSLWNNKKGNANAANNDITVVVNGETVLAPVFDAKIGDAQYRTMQDAINAVQNGETITVLRDIATNVEIKEKDNVKVTIDGNGMKMTGTIKVVALSSDNDRRITIKNFNFEDTTSASVDFITSVETNHYPRITVEDCTFTGSGDATDVALRLKSSKNVEIKNCTGQGLHSFLQNTSGWNLTIEGVTVTDSKGAFALGTVQGVTVKGCEATVEGYGIRLDANTYNNNAVIEGNNVTAFIPVVVRKVNTQSNVTFEGENTFTAENNDGKWMVIGTTEYEAGVALPDETAEGNVVVALNGNGLGYDGIHGAGLAGEGTAEKPYLINNVAELEIFRNSVNAGSTKYNKDGLCVALNADIDMAGNDWSVNIGDDCANTFDGIFDGKNHTIKNLTSEETAQKADGYICTGLFGAIGGNAVVKNFTIENVTINTGDYTGNNVAAVVGFAYNAKGSIENVKVTGDININAKNAVGVGAILGYDYYSPALVVKNCEVKGNDGSAIVGLSYVGGAVGYASNKIQLLGNSVENVSITANNAAAGGVAGIMLAGGSAADNAVKNVALASNHANWKNAVGVVAGTITTGKVTIANTTIENVNTDAVAGAIYADKPATPVAKVEARIGDAYYTTFAAAYTAAKAGETVTMLADLTMSEILVLDKAITLDGNSKTLTSTAGRAINVSGADGVTIENLTINASGERAINVIQGATNVTIDNVTATAANYTVNLASSAGAAKVAINNSNLTGLNVVNVGAAGAEVTVENTTINTVDNNAKEGYSSLALNKDAVGGKIIATGVTINITGSACDDSVQATNAADGGVISINGSTDGVAIDVAAVEHGDYYYGFTTIEAAIEHAEAGQTVKLVRDVTVAQPVAINKAITLDGNNKTLTYTGSNRAITVENNADADIDVTIKNLTINNTASYTERGINYNENGTLTLENVTVNGEHTTYAINLPGMSQNAKVVIKDSNFTGLIALNIWGANTQVTAENSEFYSVDHSTAEGYAAIKLNNNGSTAANGSTVVINGGKVIAKDENGAASIAVEDCTSGSTVTISAETEVVGSTIKSVAIISYGSQFYAFSTIEEAIEFAKAGDVVTLISDITTSAQININKNVAIDGNGKKLTVNAARGFQITGGTVAISNLTIDMPNAAEGNRGINLYNGDTNAALDVTLNNVTINGGKAYAVNIGGGKDNKLTINGSTLTGYAAINVHTSSVNHTIVVDGSTLNGKNHNNYYSFGTVVVDGTNAHSLTITNTTITTENLEGVTSKYDKVVVSANCTLNWDGGEAAVRSILADSKGGKLYYTDLQTAINDAAEVSGTVQILGNITATKSIAIPAAKTVTIDLNGKTITGADNETKSYGLININPGAVLTINDATGNGAIKLTATENRGWNAYSSVISNQRGKLTVNGGTIEHLGGTDMAYAIDNLTNTGAQNAETVINGGTIKSTYRAVRQFLNSTTAQNILTVNGGTIEGTNKSIWMQDANANANPGALTVVADAAIKGDVYLTVTAGSAKWPVAVAVAAAALQGESKVLTTNVPAGYDLANVNGIYGIYSGAAKIGTTYYETVDAAIKAAKAGETVNILAGTYPVPSMKAGITVEGAVNADGTPAVLLEGTLSGTLENLTLKNLHIKGGNAQRWAYAKGNLVFENVIFDATSVYAIHFDGIAAGTNLTYKNCTIIGWAAMGGTPDSCVFDGCTIKGNGTYGVIRTYFDAEIKDCTFDVSNVNTNDAYEDGIHAVDGAEVVVDDCTNVNGTMKDLVNIHGTSEVTVDGVVYKNVAKVADKNYITIEDAFAAWADGTTLTLLTDIALDTKTLVTECDGYASIVNVEGKAITIDLNGKTITVAAAAADLANTKGNMLMAVFSVDEGGKLTIDDSSEDKTGAVNVTANGATVYSLASAYGKDAKLTINNGSYCIDEMFGATSLIYAQHSESVIINGGTYNVGNLGTGANDSPWIFNTKGQNVDGIYVYGGTYPTDINHQFWFNEAIVPANLAVKDNGDGTWSVVEAVAYTNEVGRSTGSWRRNVGYATIEEAIAATQMYNCEGNVVTLAKSVEIENTITVANGVEVTLNLNGNTISGTDNGTASFGLINNKGDLTINDSSEEAAGKITLTATNNRGWSAYSSVISNQPGGKLTVNGGTIEHLGGTSMAWGIDNLTNGKGTYAETIINGGVVKSKYIAIRQFLNGVEAQNILTVDGGTLEGETASLYFQDPSAKANTGTLNVLDGTLAGDVYLDVTEGSTEWPVEVYIAKDALGQNVIHADNVPADAAALVEYDTFWQVEQKNLAELTIKDACEEYINKIEKNVGVLTYERYFDDTEWQTIVLPFDVPVANLMDQFEVAYIYNASYKGKKATIDYVVIDENSVVEKLSANYPYMIRAKEAGWNNIVVDSAKLMPTADVETLDCSSIFEEFSFIGTYATVDANELDATKGYFSLNGTWSKMDVVNPFRFYMQIKLRNGAAFEYPTDAANSILMRSVNANGEATTGIDGVDAEQAGDFIFDLQGRRVAEPEKGGIYIINGQKVLVK